MRAIVLCFFFFASLQCAGQTTIFILFRHAEKMQDGTKDPDLSAAGQERATRLAALLKETKVDAIYTTPFRRTTSTVAPLSTAKGITPVNYEAMKPGPIDEMLKKHGGGTILVCGHSNSIPWTANYLTGKKDIADFADDEYGNILIVEVTELGKGKVVRLVY